MSIEYVNNVIGIFTELSSGVDDILGKEWLKPCIISHIKRTTDYPESFIMDIVDIIYLSDNI